jgi:kinesin family protein C2/C3
VSGQAQKEAIAINTSLAALGDVIAGLGGGKGKHVPFRNSKLTHLLSDSLMGQSKCLMFLNISPSSSNYSETTSSMLFGQRCRKVELGKAEKNTSAAKKKKGSATD